MSFQSTLKFALISFVFLQGIQNVLSCYVRSPEFVYSYQWKVREKPIYQGNSLKEIVKLCPNGCTNCSIPSCDKDAIESIKIAREQAKEFQEFAKNMFIPMLIRLALVAVIIIGNIYLCIFGHFRIQDLWYRTAQSQWQVEEDPTSGVEPHIWANMKVTVNKKKPKDKKAPEKKPETEFTPNPITQGRMFWRFHKIMNLYYGRERYYRMARAFNPLKWQIKNLGSFLLDGNNEENEFQSDADATAEETDKDANKQHKEGDEGDEDYNWQADLIRGDFSQPLLRTVFGKEAEQVISQQKAGHPVVVGLSTPQEEAPVSHPHGAFKTGRTLKSHDHG